MRSIIKKRSIKLLLTKFLILTTTIPMLLFGLIAIMISYKVLRTELLEANDKEVELIVKHANDYLKESENIIKSLIEKINNIDTVSETNLLSIKSIIADSHDFILGIQVSDLNGIVKSIYPSDHLILGSDISGHEYYKKSIQGNAVYWSSSFMSELTSTPVVSVSSSANKYIITLFLSLEGISKLASYSFHSINHYITITDQKGVYISHPETVRVRLRQYDLSFQYFKDKWKGSQIQEVVTVDGDKYFSNIYFIPVTGWKIALFLPISELYKPGFFLGFWLMIISLFIVSIVLFFGSKVNKRISNSFSILLKNTTNIAKGDYNFIIPSFKYDEFKDLSNSFNLMAKEIHNREKDLIETHKELSMHKDNLEFLVKERTQELNNTITNLKETQKQLVESEKMASLGELVAGISHEINTPIGIIVTGASYLDDEIKNINKKIANGELTKKNFEEYNQKLQNSIELILSNSQRASNLIKSFKQVSADQTSDFKREFQIKEYITEILNSLHPQLKNKRVLIDINCNKELKIYSYPGALAQIITNLVLNSVNHGFDKKEEGNITINVTDNKEFFLIKYIDNGKGMDKESSSKLFEPFFTTKRGRGGTGLGMHIVYNVVTQKLKGTISCISSPGNGVEFDIELPVLV